MTRTILLLATILLLPLQAGTSLASSAQCGLSSVRLAAGLVRVGDGERRVIESGPDRTVRLETPEGGAAGYRHDFYLSGQTVQIYVRAGVITRVCRVRG